MTIEQLIETCVQDAIYETNFEQPDVRDLFAKCQFTLKRHVRERLTSPLTFNKLRELMKRRVRKEE